MLYAAYGSNLHPVRLTRRTPSAAFLGTRFVPGWDLSFHKRSPDNSGKCMVRHGTTGIHVAVYELDPSEKPILDGIEGVGRGYHADVIDVPEYGACHTYLPQDGYVDTALEPWHWYRELVLLGCRWHGFPDAYCDAVAAVRAPVDPDAARRRLNEEIVALLKADGRND